MTLQAYYWVRALLVSGALALGALYSIPAAAVANTCPNGGGHFNGWIWICDGHDSSTSTSTTTATYTSTTMGTKFIQGGVEEAERAVYNEAIKRGVPGGVCACPAGYTRIGFNNARPIYDAKEIGAGDGAWCYSGDAYEGATAATAPCLPPTTSTTVNGVTSVLDPLTYYLELSIDAELKSRADCQEKVEQGIKLSTTLLPAGAAHQITEAGEYCQTMFPEAASPSQKITMAAYFTVHTFEECVTKVSLTEKFAVSVKAWYFNRLEKIGEAKEYCLERYQGAGGKVTAAQLKAIENLDPSNLTVPDVDLTVPREAPVTHPPTTGGTNPTPPKPCPSWGIAVPDCGIAW